MPSLSLSEISTKSPSVGALCPFHDGAATLDALLAELDPHDAELFDAALDLRLAAEVGDAEAGIAQLFRLRALLDGRHYLAFYRVRCWAQRALRVEVRAQRNAPWLSRPLGLDGGRIDEVINTALAELAVDGEIPAGASVRFVFRAGA